MIRINISRIQVGEWRLRPYAACTSVCFRDVKFSDIFVLWQRGVNVLFIRPSDVTNSKLKLRRFFNSLTFYVRILNYNYIFVSGDFNLIQIKSFLFFIIWIRIITSAFYYLIKKYRMFMLKPKPRTTTRQPGGTVHAISCTVPIFVPFRLCNVPVFVVQSRRV